MPTPLELVQEAIAQQVFPGAAFAMGTSKTLEIHTAGHLTYGQPHPVTPRTLYDLASLTKVIGTTTAAMILYEEGKLDLDEPMPRGFAPRNLLLHNSGLPAFRRYEGQLTTPDQVRSAIQTEPLDAPPGTQTVYSDHGMITLAWHLEELTGLPLDQLFQTKIFSPLGMSDTGFNPKDPSRAAPTEPVESWRKDQRGPFTQGQVHDPTAYLLGGIAAHAGLFSTIEDLAKFGVCLLRHGPPIVKPETLAYFTTRPSNESSRALGWDTNLNHAASAGPTWPESAYGHTGFTGTSIWVDPSQDLFAILLTNRVHPTATNTQIVEFRRNFHTAVAYANEAGE